MAEDLTQKEKNKKIYDLMRELKQESFYEGRCTALYDHTTIFHTVKERSEMLNHRMIKEKIFKEIEHLLNE